VGYWGQEPVRNEPRSLYETGVVEDRTSRPSSGRGRKMSNSGSELWAPGKGVVSVGEEADLHWSIRGEGKVLKKKGKGGGDLPSRERRRGMSIWEGEAFSRSEKMERSHKGTSEGEEGGVDLLCTPKRLVPPQHYRRKKKKSS